MAGAISTALLTGNYTAAAAGETTKIDFSKAIKSEKILTKALEKYSEAIENSAPVELMLPLLTPEWLKPGNKPQSTLGTSLGFQQPLASSLCESSYSQSTQASQE